MLAGWAGRAGEGQGKGKGEGSGLQGSGGFRQGERHRQNRTEKKWERETDDDD